MDPNTLFITPDADREDAFYHDMANRTDDLNPEELLRAIKYEEKNVGLLPDRNNTELVNLNPVELSYKIFFSPEELDIITNRPKYVDMRVKEKVYRHLLDRNSKYFNRAKILDILSSDMGSDDDLDIGFRIRRLTDQLCDSWNIVLSTNRIYDRKNNPTQVPLEVTTNPSLFRCSMPDFEELNVFQKCIMAIFDSLHKNDTKRYRGYTCKEIITTEGYKTRAWKQDEPIKDYVHRIANKETWYELWKDLTSSNGTAMFSQVIKHLTDCTDIQFPEIVKNRRVWSFKNGIFIGSKWSDKTGLYHTVFYPYHSKDYKNLDPTIVSCKYFDVDFEDHGMVEDWSDIPTPHFESVLTYQEFSDDVIKWMYILGGRLCFELNELDKWQIIPFLKGIARSGKSTLITKVFCKFYETADVKTIANNIERKFGLSSIHNALMFVAPEIKGDFQLEQAEFQSIVSGEEVSLAVKCETAKTLIWKVPGILGGNEVPQYKDKSGSILRRMVTFHFGKQVTDKDTDPMLDTKLESEIPVIIEKCLRGYLEYAQKYQNRDIWSILPKYFFKIREQIASATNPLERYLQLEMYKNYEIKMGENLKFPIDLFEEMFLNFCSDKKIARPTFNNDFYNGSFSTRGIKIQNEVNDYWIITNPERLSEPDNYKGRKVLYGISLVAKENTKGYDVTSYR